MSFLECLGAGLLVTGALAIFLVGPVALICVLAVKAEGKPWRIRCIYFAGIFLAVAMMFAGLFYLTGQVEITDADTIKEKGRF